MAWGRGWGNVACWTDDVENAAGFSRNFRATHTRNHARFRKQVNQKRMRNVGRTAAGGNGGLEDELIERAQLRLRQTINLTLDTRRVGGGAIAREELVVKRVRPNVFLLIIAIGANEAFPEGQQLDAA